MSLYVLYFIFPTNMYSLRWRFSVKFKSLNKRNIALSFLYILILFTIFYLNILENIFSINQMFFQQMFPIKRCVDNCFFPNFVCFINRLKLYWQPVYIFFSLKMKVSSFRFHFIIIWNVQRAEEFNKRRGGGKVDGGGVILKNFFFLFVCTEAVPARHILYN